MSPRRAGVSLAELLITMVVSGILLAGAATVFVAFQRSVEQQDTVRMVQTELHRSVEELVRVVRNAEGVSSASTADRLVVDGGIAMAACGAASCWVEAQEDGVLAIGPVGSADGRAVVTALEDFTVWYGVDADGDGTVTAGEFVASPSGTPEDVLGVRMDLSLAADRARGEFEGRIEVHAALRARVIERLTLPQGS